MHTLRENPKLRRLASNAPSHRPPSLHRVQLTSLGLRSVDPARHARQTVAPVVRRVSRPGAHSEQVLLATVEGRKYRGGQASSRTAPAALPPVCPVAVADRPVTNPPGAIWHAADPVRAVKEGARVVVQNSRRAPPRSLRG